MSARWLYKSMKLPNPPSSRMTKPYWLVGEKWRREGVIVDGDDVWEFVGACADGDNATVRRLLEKDRNLIHAQLWYSKPIDHALRYGHLEVVRTIHEFDRENRLALYINGHYCRCDEEEMRRRGHTHLIDYLENEYRPRLVPHYVPGLDEMGKFFPGEYDEVQEMDEDHILTTSKENARLLSGTDRQGRSLMHMAIAAKKLSLAKELAALGAAIDRRTADHQSLTDCAAHWLPEAIPWLLELGLEPSFQTAVAAGLTEQVRAMAKEDPAIVNRVSAEEESPLHLAANHRQREMVALLLELGADPNFPESNSPSGAALAVASMHNEVEIMRLLLEAGANPNANIDSSGTCYMFCTHWGRKHPEEAVALLLQYGAEPPKEDSDSKQRTLLEFSKQRREKKSLPPPKMAPRCLAFRRPRRSTPMWLVWATSVS